jgi:hypothetical protein
MLPGQLADELAAVLDTQQEDSMPLLDLIFLRGTPTCFRATHESTLDKTNSLIPKATASSSKT